jgi:hypothetical protein
MRLTTCWLLVVFTGILTAQFSSDPVRTAELQARMQYRQEPTRAPQADPSVAKAAQLQFEQRYNNLVEAVARFSRSYNGGKGALWPAKDALALQKAMRELQEIPGWKKPGSRTSPASK